MSSKPPFEADPAFVAEHLIELGARNAVLEGVLRHVTALLFAGGPGGAAAFEEMRSQIMTGFKSNASAPPDTDDEVASEMQTRSIEYARAFLDKVAEIRQGIADACVPQAKA